MKVLVTGSEGFIGSSLVRHLSAHSAVGTVFKADKTNGQDLKNLLVVNELPDVDCVYHLAAFNGTRYFYSNPREVTVENTLPTLNLTERYHNGTTRFIFASTCEIFNSAIDLGISGVPTSEDVPIVFDDTTNPRWSYSLPKALGENLVSNAFASSVIIRFFNIFGPGQKDHFIPEFVGRVKDGNCDLYGNDTRSFCFVEDAVDMAALVGQSDFTGIMNIGRQIEYEIEVVARMILEIMGENQTNLRVLDSPKGSVTRRCPLMDKFSALFGDYEYSDFEESLEVTVKSYL